jgi:catechol 2,3-dioxygenase-like lactoylglutathione lyase family enzyme
MLMAAIRNVDAVMLRVPDLDQGLAFYRDHLGHRLLWRSQDRCGLAMAGSETELVLSTGLGPETDLKVESVDEAAASFITGGGRIVAGPEEIPIGKLVVVADPFGNQLVLLDSSKGRYRVDDAGEVLGVEP